ncbi:hypothetical protein L1887_29047 [Cichorium endivia]|nr:hypothetical protein L1887_29047 [Cichorium endivia]
MENKRRKILCGGAESYLKSEQEWNRWFKWLKLGISQEVDFDRLAWVRLHGLPIHLRSLENITSVVGSIGKVLEVGGYNWATADLTTSTARILTTSKLLINDVVNCAYNGKMYKVGVVECAEAWDPISSYYEGSEFNSDNEDMDINDEDEQDDDGSDGDANSEAWRNDVEEGEIIAESNNNEFPVGDPPATIPVSLEKVNPNPNNSLFNVVDERLHGEENMDCSTRPNRGANFEACGATSGDSLGVKLPDPVNIPLPDSPIQPTEPICTYKTSGFEWNPINSMAATELNEISRPNLGNSSKRRKLNKSSRSSVSVNVDPRNLVDDFDLNVAIPSHSDSSNRLDCSSSSSIEVEKIIQIGNQVGFKVDDAGSHRIVDEVLGNIPFGEGAIDERATWRNNKVKIIELEKFAKLDLQQKAKIKWLRDGDENTRYFHGVLKNKCRKSRIHGLTIDGVWMNFGVKWRKWIWGCLSSARASILVNGAPTEEFSISRGVRQGDPLSPFLFILAMEGLNIAIKTASEKSLIQGIKLPHNGPSISHLFYADDAVFVGNWNRESIKNLSAVLKCFYISSGLKVNFLKSRLFGIGVSSLELQSMAHSLGCAVGSFPFIYLGVPVGANMGLKKHWQPIIPDKDSVSQLKIAIEDCKGDYEILIEREALGDCGVGVALTSSSSSKGGDNIWSSLWRWAKLVFVVIFVAVLGVCFFIWIGPFLMNREVIPILNWETETFNKPALAAIIFASVALFPTFLLPSTPSMWVAGMTFGYGLGFLLIIGGVIIGTSLPYFFGSLFYHKIEEWLERFPKKASILRLAGEGNWCNQFKAVVLLRISPFPYVVYNYCAVATGVHFCPYLFGTFVGVVPEIFVAIYTGIMIRTLADASNDRRSLSAQQIICTVVGFLLTVTTTVGVTVYAKRRLSKLQKEEEKPLIQ